MTDWNLPWEGGCRCGQVRLKITAPPLITMACHCTGCQRMSSSAFSLTAILQAAGFEVTQGEPVIGGLRGEDARHYFCGHCMTWMFTRPAQMEMIVNLRPTLLDEPRWIAPFIETYASAKLPWATTGATYSFDEFPPMSEYQRLMQEYAARA
jgi:hypothetical protein